MDGYDRFREDEWSRIACLSADRDRCSGFHRASIYKMQLLTELCAFAPQPEATNLLLTSALSCSEVSMLHGSAASSDPNASPRVLPCLRLALCTTSPDFCASAAILIYRAGGACPHRS